MNKAGPQEKLCMDVQRHQAQILNPFNPSSTNHNEQHSLYHVSALLINSQQLC